MDESIPVRWNRQQWLCVFSSHSPTIRKVTEYLGLGLSASSSNTNRGIPKFDAPEYRRLSAEVTRLSKDLPKDRDALLDVATDGSSLEDELDDLLGMLGPQIWGRNADRSRLLTPDPSSKTYTKDLFYEDPEDREIIKTHIHRWIIIKACYYIRNQKLKRSSAPGDYETLADLDAADGAPSPTKPQLLSPEETLPSTSLQLQDSSSALPINVRKRKSEASFDQSDDEDDASRGAASAPPMKRSYSSATMPLPRKSPRKSLAAVRLSPENLPPIASQSDQRRSPASSVAPSEASRPLLSPLSSNALNGAPRVANPAPNGFTAVNAPAAPAAAPSPPKVPIAPGNGYNSPYGAPHAAQNESSTPNGASVHVTPAVQNGTSARNSPGVPNTSHANIAPKPPLASSTPPLPIHSHTPPHSMNTQNFHSINSQNPPPPANVHNPSSVNAQTISYGANPVNQQHAYHNHSIPNGPAAVKAHHSPQMYSSPNFSPHLTILPSNAPLQSNGPLTTNTQPQSDGPPPNGRIKEMSNDNVQAVNPHDIDMLQFELLPSLMKYFFPKNGPQTDEYTLLHMLEQVWARNESTFRRQMGSLYDAQGKVLQAWIEERRKISQLQRSMEGQPGVPHSEMIDRLLAMNDLRVMRLKWKAMTTYDGSQGVSPEELLCRTFATMTKTEGTEHLFQGGLEKLNESIFEFLRSEDMKISMARR
ncbi:hypothetical protein CC78DRAFT_32995 [Lojkania enalia]|uniref:Uncharacterized protein n=1 Tax=Lojkania enalia TaxID=147567 RepID=A0A9P4N662_9PLEO|nr:hypothetical protein CC78DRAFT_32995 [Didymosphaeria enalia]